MPDQPPPLEIELKLAATAEAMETLLASPLLRDHARSTVRSRQLVSVYYDTDDHRFSDRQIALRVRQSGKKFVQTLKAARAGGSGEGAASTRAEWEVQLPDGTPDLTAFGDPAALELTGLVLPEELVPIFETRFKRRAVLLSWPNPHGTPAEVEIAFDRGVVRAGSRELPIAEVELELKGGEPTALFELAETLRAQAPLSLQPQDKAARGYGLALARPPAWRKARPIELKDGLTVEQGLQRVLGACLRHWLDNVAAAAEGGDPEGLHQLRVGIRRLRSALSLFRPALGDAARHRWADELKWFLGPLGPARDLDVFATEVMAPVAEARAGDPSFAVLAAVVDERRRAAAKEVRTALASQRYGDLALGLAIWVARQGWRQGADVDVLLAQRGNIRDFAVAVLAKRYKQVRKRGRRFEELTPEARHELRIAFKKLRYGTEFFQALFKDKQVERFRKAAAAMQDVLGHLNDVAVAEHTVQGLLAGLPASGERQRAAALASGQVLGWYAHQTSLLEPEAVAAWNAFLAAEPFWDEPG